MTAIILLLLAAARPDPGLLVAESRPAMGSLATVTVVAASPRRAAAAFDAAFRVFARVDAVMNEWRPESPLSRLNAAAGRGWIALPADLCDVLALAKRGAERTHGRFDPTWAALSDLWRFDGTQDVAPSDDDVRARCPLVNYRDLVLRPRGRACEAQLARAGMRVGLGGIAKGWALDRAASALRRLGFRDFLLQAGGDLYAAGARGGAPWRVRVRDPRGGDLDALASVDVRDQAFSTSGDYEHAFVSGGRRYHHLIDPRTCRPAERTRAVSVLARSAVEAEILGKSLFVEGGAAALAEARGAGAEALVATAEGDLVATPGLPFAKED
jgi:thiamine biosynthesis lipoprotein